MSKIFNVLLFSVNLVALASEHSERVLQKELRQQKMLKERQDTFDEVFRGEIENYKATGVVPRKFAFLFKH